MLNYRIKLRNGEYAELKLEKRESRSGYAILLLQILRGVKERLGYLPSQEEAEQLPDMPENMGLYNKYLISYTVACRELNNRSENAKSWRKPTDEEKKEIEKAEAQADSRLKYLESVKRYRYKEVANIGKKQAKHMSEEKKEELLKAVIMEYEANGNIMPTPRQLKKSHLLKLYELWDAFGSYEGLCKVIDKRLGQLELDEKVKTKRAYRQKEKIRNSKAKKEVAKVNEVKAAKDPKITKVNEVTKEVKSKVEATEVVKANEVEEAKAKVEATEVVKGTKGETAKEKRRKSCMSEERLIEKMRAYATIHGELPTQAGLKRAKEAGEQWPAYSTFIRRLGGASEWAERYLEDIDLSQEKATTKPDADKKELPEELSEKRIEPQVELLEGSEVKPLGIHLSVSISMPGLDKPFELALDLDSK